MLPGRQNLIPDLEQLRSQADDTGEALAVVLLRPEFAGPGSHEQAKLVVLESLEALRDYSVAGRVPADADEETRGHGFAKRC